LFYHVYIGSHDLCNESDQEESLNNYMEEILFLIVLQLR